MALGGAAMNSITVSGLTRDTHGPNNASNFGHPKDDMHYIRPRFNTDQWDKYFAVRDLRLTGSFRGQSDAPEAHESFETNSVQPFNNTTKPWVLRKHIIMKNSPTKWLRKYGNKRDNDIQEMKDQYIKDMGN
ncbi:unnamed protein product [Kuraishia capsulata CBS 1993]|uniref:Uncharacterized protein n=1 Tax=Kuraishia capsulata CBS 1993 TaxID=1382522 RepID=W6MK87_9ASCO|nr:uncharacterized protein KUCA_T00002735001 [Kuraishia capsulata CBS 1993]CDK26761.1 unnamed protein product [Kuraishia capsulata CBS 1993]